MTLNYDNVLFTPLKTRSNFDALYHGKGFQPPLGVLGASFRAEEFSEIVGYSNMADYTSHNMRIARGKTMLINKTSTFLFTRHIKNNV